MAIPAPSEPRGPTRMTVERYFALVDEGLLEPDDRVELLEGVVVAMSPRNPLHDTVVSLVDRALARAVGGRAAVRCQCSLVLGRWSVPEPDVLVVPGRERDYLTAHPTTALLAIEVADTSLAQDRLTKAALYAAAGIPEYWIVNLRDDCVEVHRAPVPEDLRYAMRRLARRGETIGLERLPGAMVEVDALLPTPPVDGDSVEG